MFKHASSTCSRAFDNHAKDLPMQVASSCVPVSHLADFGVSVQSTTVDVCVIFRASRENQLD